MKEINCNIVRDILPLYVDDVVCDDTKILVEEHLEHCEDCQKELEKLMRDIVLPSSADIQLQEAQTLKKFKKRMNWRQRMIAFISVLMTAVLLIGGWYVLFQHGLPASTDDIIAKINFVPDEEGYLGQRWAIAIQSKENKRLNFKQEFIYEQNSAGQLIESGYNMYVYEMPLSTDAERYGIPSIGYIYDGEFPPSEDFDYTINIIYKDKTYTYSMREEGMFIKQELNEKNERIQE